jgi:hypothetical protein
MAGMPEAYNEKECLRNDRERIAELGSTRFANQLTGDTPRSGHRKRRLNRFYNLEGAQEEQRVEKGPRPTRIRIIEVTDRNAADS